MHAEVGDRILVGGNPERTGLIIEVPRADGTPPYVIRWLATGHIALVVPPEYARILRAGDAADRPAPPPP